VKRSTGGGGGGRPATQSVKIPIQRDASQTLKREKTEGGRMKKSRIARAGGEAIERAREKEREGRRSN